MIKKLFTQDNQEKLTPKLNIAIKALLNTKEQCREMLQLVDNLTAHMDTAERKKQHAHQQDYWVSNLDHVSKHLTVMEESVRQIESGKLKPSKSMRKSILMLIENAKEFANHIGDVYHQIIVSIAPIEAEVQREIDLEQQEQQH